MTPIATTAWTAEQVAGIAAQHGWALPLLGPADLREIRPNEVVWDMWQLADRRARTVVRDGRSFWFFLAAPREEDHDARHHVARIRLTSHGADGWRDHGVTFPDGWTPGSREWSGSALLEDDGRTVVLYFTAAGRRGAPSFEQRLFASTGRFALVDGEPRADRWSEPSEVLAADGAWYLRADQAEAIDDRIKGFRDPGWFQDPVDGAEYLVFTASAARVDAIDDGVIGLARLENGHWRLAPPLVDAVGVNSELERPHIVAHAGRYYLFWSTQAKRFAAAAGAGVTGLYGMWADRMEGPWRPLNGTGLVAGNPPSAPTQAYCWWVTGELDVASFIDLWGTSDDPSIKVGVSAPSFGGTPAPFFRLRVERDRATIA